MCVSAIGGKFRTGIQFFLLYRKLQHLCCNFWNNKIASLIPRPQAGLLSEAFLLYRKLQHLCCNFWNNKIVSLIPRPQAGLLSEAFL